MKPRTCYIAGRFERRLTEVQVTSVTRWLHLETDMRVTDEAQRQRDALMDLEDVRNADFLLALSEDLETENEIDVFALETPHYEECLWVPAIWARGGRHVEFGVAIAEGLDIVVIGPKENIFHYLGDAAKMHHFATLNNFIEWKHEQG